MYGGQAIWANGPLCTAVATPAPPPTGVLPSTYTSVIAGATSVNVKYNTGIVAYQVTVTISDRSNAETRVVTAVGNDGQVMFQEPLEYSYTPGQVQVKAVVVATILSAATDPPTTQAATNPPTTRLATDPPTTRPATDPPATEERGTETRHNAGQGKAAKATKGKNANVNKGAKNDEKSKSGKGKTGKSGALAAKNQVTRQRAITAVGASALLAMVGMVGIVAAFIRLDITKRAVTTTYGSMSEAVEPSTADHLLADVAEPSMAAANAAGTFRGKVSGYMLPATDAKVGDLIMGK